MDLICRNGDFVNQSMLIFFHQQAISPIFNGKTSTHFASLDSPKVKIQTMELGPMLSPAGIPSSPGNINWKNNSNAVTLYNTSNTIKILHQFHVFFSFSLPVPAVAVCTESASTCCTDASFLSPPIVQQMQDYRGCFIWMVCEGLQNFQCFYIWFFTKALHKCCIPFMSGLVLVFLGVLDFSNWVIPCAALLSALLTNPKWTRFYSALDIRQRSSNEWLPLLIFTFTPTWKTLQIHGIHIWHLIVPTPE